MSNIKYVFGLVVVILFSILSFSSFVEKSGNIKTVNSEVIKAINYVEGSKVFEDIEYKSDLSLRYKINGKEYNIETIVRGTYLEGDILEINVNNENPQKLMGSKPIIDFVVGCLFLFVAILIIFMSDTFSNFVRRRGKKVENKIYYSEEEYKKIKEDNIKKRFYLLKIIAGVIVSVVFIYYGISNIYDYFQYKEKSICSQKVKVTESNDKGVIVNWIDEDNREHFQYINDSNYEVGMEYYLYVEKDTKSSKKIEKVIYGVDVIRDTIPAVCSIVFTVFCIYKFRKLKKVQF